MKAGNIIGALALVGAVLFALVTFRRGSTVLYTNPATAAASGTGLPPGTVYADPQAQQVAAAGGALSDLVDSFGGLFH